MCTVTATFDYFPNLPCVQQELAEKEASAWEGFAGAVGDDHEEAARALRKAEGLLVR